MASWRSVIENTLDKDSALIFYDEPLSKHTTFRIGGPAECFIIINSKDNLKKLLQIVRDEKIPLFVIGNGSNLLISDQGLKGITIKLGKNFSYAKIEHNLINVGAGMLLSKLIDFAVKNSLAGLEFLYGIPATFGGAVVSNAGAFSHDMSSIIKSINGFLPNGQEISISSSKLKFEYRKVNLPHSFIITDGSLKCIPNKQDCIRKSLKSYWEKRNIRQPHGMSAGSVFKNPKTTPAGKIIDECGLKGLAYRGAMISKKHGNFIINKNNACFKDVYELIQIIKSAVEAKTGIILEEEIQILPCTCKMFNGYLPVTNNKLRGVGFRR